MANQTATTGNLADVQNVAIAQCLYTEEHNAPCVNLIEKFKLKKGQKQLTVPKVAQMTASDLTDGIDIIDSEDIGVSSVDLTSNEVGLRVLFTYKLVRQFNESVVKIVGKQMGDAMARKKDEDIIALFSSLNGGTAKGADDKNMTFQNVAACIAWAQAVPIPRPYSIVHHPNALYGYQNSLTSPALTYPMPSGYAQELLKDWYWNTTSGPARVPMFHDGNINKIPLYDSGYGAILSKGALCIIEQLGYTTETDKDISMRAHEIVVTADYGCFELDDSYGAALHYEIGDPATNN